MSEFVGYRTYSTPVDADDNQVPASEATHTRWTVNEVFAGGEESIADEWITSRRHHPDPEQAKADAGDEAYHERREAGL